MKIDAIDQSILNCIQADGSLSQREVAERVGLSQNACWRRMQRLTQAGIIRGATARLDARALGLDLTVMVFVKTRNHSPDWSARFRAKVESIPEIASFHRIGGEWDYFLKVVTTSMAGYDTVYQQLITVGDLETVTGHFSMETIFDGRPLRVRVIG
ncbi:Lrp/AsnC family transcriptional regulator [Albidovulum sediminicola]|uniref:Lrp/AsnC family transcriptional regulator n=1 Tax=Albidovulum sediminicola TaxID=2984331 RepID=A0ABT2YX20_9RHOB|nr:Lrp/AsnC family transcriptional regulator [Defluviimonas sp. WL0075]MCV2863415.1 Lrp/AsnC family transcriptional regulator [Defluviimonas sp. WL0075]